MSGDEEQEGLVRRIAARPDARIEGTDLGGAVTVVVDVNERVIDLALDADWRRRYGPKTLGRAILEAKEAASLRYAALRFVGDQDVDGEGTVLPPLVDEESEWVGGPQLSIEEMAGLLSDYAAERAAYWRDRRGLAVRDREIVDSGGGWVTAHVRGATVVDFEFAPTWFHALSATMITESIIRLYECARTTLNDEKEGLLQRYPAVARLLTNSPL